jgi:hypothetical protein
LATEREAKRALDQHAEALRKEGAHAIGLEPGEDGFVVIVYVEKPDRQKFPKTLGIKKSKSRVPLVVRKAERFRPQAL